MSALVFCPVSSIDRPVTTIRSDSTRMIVPVPMREESVTSTPVSLESRASASAPAGASSAECPNTPVTAMARCHVGPEKNAAFDPRSISTDVNGGPELTGSRK